MYSNRRITITEVAALANVSISTVSHYLNSTKNLKKATADRIQAAIAELNYMPNANARSLKQKKTHVIGIIIPDMVIYGLICQYIECYLYEYQYSVIICNTGFDQSKERIQLQSLMEQRVDGLIIASSGGNSSLIEHIRTTGTPVVMFDRPLAELQDIDYVLEKNEYCITRITKHVVEQGHRNIAYIKGPDNSTVSQLRFKIFSELLEAEGLPSLPRFYYNNVITNEDCQRVSDDIFQNRHQVSAVIMTNANQIKNFIMTANKNRITVPEEMSFTGFGLEEYKTLFRYPITCIIQSHFSIAQSCSKRILELIELLSSNQPMPPPQTILVDSEFFIGTSVRRME